jgi:AAA+ ATPase superfamily predicted ATPase
MTSQNFGDFFPQGLALGENFCNRVDERALLRTNISSSRPTLIISPRRYGKTSLVLVVLSEMKIPYSHIDLYSELNETEVQNTILGAIGDILYTIETGSKKSLAFVTNFFSDLNASFKFEGSKIRIEFSKIRKSPAKTILDALQKLDETLAEKNKKAVLFLDEFQRINQISESLAIEGALRQVAQKSKNISFIFSGSNRTLLLNVFYDKAKPLYKLCERIIIERISESDYSPFIKSKFEKTKNHAITTTAITSILEITEQHPYYVNVLCHKVLCSQTEPTEKNIEAIWHKYAMEEKTHVSSEIDLLSNNQAKMLIAIAKYGDEFMPMSSEFIALTKFSMSSASQSLKVLIKKDYVQENSSKKYFIVDPLIKYLFSEKYFV